ncbi:transcriptional regulator, GntR family [Primorskyibacter flagellatus]|uniref:Transcriptional regulator, GntR family n=2 Tax=Primorskyibacter flagellatus TaxID=1387277 RepID=A0A1W1YUG0_9RHOB|nr:transcriptional regulator, GntR family [Primorskyibacter flagellatus]
MKPPSRPIIKTQLAPIAPRMLAETIVDAIVEAAAKGQFLPGDRIIEADLARQLNVSRVPVREALRLLESRGVVENTPYRGMRLMEVSKDSMRSLRKVRLTLEMLAATEIQNRAEKEPELLNPLAECVQSLRDASRAKDYYRVAIHDIEFHRRLCQVPGNRALMQAWEPLAQQLTIVIGLSTFLQPTLVNIVEEHEELLGILQSGTPEELERNMQTHILEVPDAVNYERLRANRDNVKKQDP